MDRTVAHWQLKRSYCECEVWGRVVGTPIYRIMQSKYAEAGSHRILHNDQWKFWCANTTHNVYAWDWMVKKRRTEIDIICTLCSLSLMPSQSPKCGENCLNIGTLWLKTSNKLIQMMKMTASQIRQSIIDWKCHANNPSKKVQQKFESKKITNKNQSKI